MLPKKELLLRVDEWNTALDAYLHERAGLAPADRAAVRARHTASPLAPCANPGCPAVEAKVKSFRACSRCKRVAYCRAECQKAHWKLPGQQGHKQKCVGVTGVAGKG